MRREANRLPGKASRGYRDYTNRQQAFPALGPQGTAQFPLLAGVPRSAFGSVTDLMKR